MCSKFYINGHHLLSERLTALWGELEERCYFYYFEYKFSILRGTFTLPLPFAAQSPSIDHTLPQAPRFSSPAFRNCLSSARGAPSTDYYDLVDFYREIDHQIREYDKRASNRSKAPRTTSSTGRLRTIRSTPAIGSESEGYIPTAAECTMLSQHGRCYKCGGHGHRIGDCTNPQMKEMQRLPVCSASKLHKVTIDCDDDDTMVEGKEES